MRKRQQSDMAKPRVRNSPKDKNAFYKDVRTHVQLKTLVRNLTKNLKNKNKTKIKRANK